jgi:hypothetical protein
MPPYAQLPMLFRMISNWRIVRNQCDSTRLWAGRNEWYKNCGKGSITYQIFQALQYGRHHGLLPIRPVPSVSNIRTWQFASGGQMQPCMKRKEASNGEDRTIY